MTNQRLTQCPHCKASFKVSEDQINAANGRVRCGACMNIFDAIAYSISKLETEKTGNDSQTKEPVPEEAPSSDTPSIDLEDSILGAPPEDTLFADNPEEDQQEDGYSGSPKLDDEFSTSFLDLDSEETASDLYTTNFEALDDETFENKHAEEAIDESWTQNILDDAQAEINDKKEPHITESDFQEPPLQAEPDFHNELQSAKVRADQHSNYEAISFEFQQDTHSGKGHWFVTTIFTLLNIILLSALIAQASWFHYEKLAKYPAIASLYQLACEQLSCTLPKLEDISLIKSHNLVVRSHPTTRKALIIDTIMVNDADFNQDFPDIALYFSDINKRTVAQRLIHPDEYLTGDLLNWPQMPSKQPIHISLEIIDPGKEAVNYSLKFFPSAEQATSKNNKAPGNK